MTRHVTVDNYASSERGDDGQLPDADVASDGSDLNVGVTNSVDVPVILRAERFDEPVDSDSDLECPLHEGVWRGLSRATCLLRA